MQEHIEKINELKSKIEGIERKLDIEKLREQLLALSEESKNPELWKDGDRARKVMKELSDVEEQISSIERVKKELNDLGELASIVDEGGEEMVLEFLTSLDRVEKEIDRFETRVYLSGKYDSKGAILSVHAGMGGTEAMDWASMLLRMYQRYCEREGWKTDLIEESQGEEAGIKSATLMINAPFAYGYLKNESGVHRLVRLSPFNADSLRQTSFAGVEVIPVMDESEDDIDIKDEDIEFDAFRSSGAGGQNVNKLSTAVRIRHIPTGLVVECQTQRTQEQNRKIALSLLKAKLWEIEEKKRKAEVESIKGEHKIAGFGNQIRSYVLHPYKQVKDNRTDMESKEPDKVLDGEISEFINAMLKKS